MTFLSDRVKYIISFQNIYIFLNIRADSETYLFDIFQKKTYNLIKVKKKCRETPIKTLCVALIGATLHEQKL